MQQITITREILGEDMKIVLTDEEVRDIRDQLDLNRERPFVVTIYPNTPNLEYIVEAKNGREASEKTRRWLNRKENEEAIRNQIRHIMDDFFDVRVSSEGYEAYPSQIKTVPRIEEELK